ncbi:Hypothetical predicted protein [Drosophila guanche]|uniref:Uncharacterized protein n=1 Tax=Drosophila guanche TaxID=7266 RepID=A0A3B0JKB8_DROGU|nr:Hypothetical predicted protein [Drosophila guanche]
MQTAHGIHSGDSPATWPWTWRRRSDKKATASCCQRWNAPSKATTRLSTGGRSRDIICKIFCKLKEISLDFNKQQGNASMDSALKSSSSSSGNINKLPQFRATQQSALGPKTLPKMPASNYKTQIEGKMKTKHNTTQQRNVRESTQKY